MSRRDGYYALRIAHTSMMEFDDAAFDRLSMSSGKRYSRLLPGVLCSIKQAIVNPDRLSLMVFLVRRQRVTAITNEGIAM